MFCGEREIPRGRIGDAAIGGKWGILFYCGLYFLPKGKRGTQRTLHIYIDGDGQQSMVHNFQKKKNIYQEYLFNLDEGTNIRSFCAQVNISITTNFEYKLN